MSEHKVLRYDRGLKGMNVFRMSPTREYDGHRIRHIEAVIKHGEAPSRWLTFDVCEYGRTGRPDSHRAPLALFRDSEDVYSIQAVQLRPNMPKDSYLLTNVPLDVANG